MKVNFNFDYVLNFHNRKKYINNIEIDGLNEDVAYENSLVKINRRNIKSITKLSNGSAVITLKEKSLPELTTIEKYDEIHDAIKKANLALDIMKQEKIYIFDDFEVDSDELNVVEGWKAMKE